MVRSCASTFFAAQCDQACVQQIAKELPPGRGFITSNSETLGYTVHSASNGREAQQELAAAERIDLILTDLSMPVMGGRALAEALALSHPSLPVIFMSAHLDLPELRELIEAAAR